MDNVLSLHREVSSSSRPGKTVLEDLRYSFVHCIDEILQVQCSIFRFVISYTLHARSLALMQLVHRDTQCRVENQPTTRNSCQKHQEDMILFIFRR